MAETNGAPSYRLGIDVGGTNTDAVILDHDLRVLAKHKSPTTADIVGGISAAMTAVLDAAGVEPSAIGRVMLGTTHATNAVLERRGLARVAVLRIGGPATKSVPPLWTWPDDLRNVVSAGEVIIDGGFEFDGSEIVPLDEDGVRAFVASLDPMPDAFAVASVFAPVSDAHEVRVAGIIREIHPDAQISLSGALGSIGLLERENACVLNAALLSVANSIVDGLSNALAEKGMHAVPYFAQNDGTLMAIDRVLQFPVLTIGSGPANSMRGAAHLSGRADAIVVDVGGTSTDVGVLASGFPRESTVPVEIGGVRTNFRMPDLLAIALGGGTKVTAAEANGAADAPGVKIGPESVGHRLTTEALCFGGATLTLSDVANASGRASFGSHSVGDLDATVVSGSLTAIDAMLEGGIDRMKLSRSPQPVIAVGGGSMLLPAELEGASEVIRPDDFDVANAIGAAIASVSAEIDQFFSVAEEGREGVIAKAKQSAIDAAVAIGADAAATEVISLEELTMAYMTDNIIRLRIKAAGPLR
ncbi:MAG: hydantoinase/oxoprolinase family protein [Actinomycetota bacterium]